MVGRQSGILNGLVLCVWLIPFYLLGIVAIAETVPSEQDQYNVLILDSYHDGYPWADELRQGIVDKMSQQLPAANLYIEHMDTKRTPLDVSFDLTLKNLRAKYQPLKFSVIVTMDDNALAFMIQYHDTLFPGVSVVFCGVENDEEDQLSQYSWLTGKFSVLDVEPNIDLALQLFSGTKQMVVISDGTTTGLAQRNQVKKVKSKYPDLKFVYLKGEELTHEQLLQRVEQLPDDAVVLGLIWLRDKDNQFFPAHQILPEISRRSARPIIACITLWQEHGVVGGKMSSGQTYGEAAAELAISILQKEGEANKMPFGHHNPNAFVFDFEQLKRWGVDESDLPKDSVIQNKQQTFYDRYSMLIWFVMAIISLLSFVVVMLTHTVHRRQLIEMRLRESQREMKILLGNLPGMAYRCENTPDWPMSFISEGSLKLTGYTSEELIGSGGITYSQITDASQQPKLWQAVQMAIDQRKSFEVVYRITTKSGEKKWVWEQGIGVFKKDKLICLEGFITGINDRKLAEEALARSEEKFRLLAENAKDLISRHDLEGRVLYISPSCKPMLGYELEELVGKTFDPLIHPDDLSITQAEFERLGKHSQSTTIRCRLQHKEGHYIWIDSLAWVHRDPQTDQPIEIQIASRDVTERVESELALEKSEARFEQFFNSAVWATALCCMEYDDQGKPLHVRMLQVNPAFAKMVGKHRYEIEGQTSPEVWPEHAQRWMAHYAQMFESGQPVRFQSPIEFIGQWFDVTAFPIEGDRFAILMDDITDKKQSEQMLRSIVEGTASATGEEFFRSVVKCLASALGASHAMVGQLVGSNTIRTLALWKEDHFEENYEYDLSVSPCKELIHRKTCVYFSDVCNEFPADQTLQKLGIESYLGIPLFDLAGDPMGVLVVLNNQTFSESLISTAQSLLTIFGSRSEAELERWHAEQQLRAIIEGTASDTGQAFFRSVVKHLSRSLNMKYALVGELSNDGQSIKTLAVWQDGDFSDNFEYQLEGTPCRNATRNTICVHTERVREQFPDSQLLINLSAESYIGTSLYDSHGQTTGVLVVLDDEPISRRLADVAVSIMKVFASRCMAELERLHTDLALRESENRIRSIINVAPIGIGVLVDRVFTSANDRMCQIFGYSHAELIGQSTCMLYASQEDYEKAGQQIYGQIDKIGISDGEYRFQCKDGKMIDVWLRGALIDTEDLSKGMTFTALDVTERKRDEEQLRLAQFTVDRAGEAIFWVDPDGRFIYVNKEVTRWLGYSSEEILTMSVPDIDTKYTAERWPQLRDTIVREKSMTFESRLRHKAGTDYPVEIFIKHIEFENQQLFVASVRDITDRKRAEELGRRQRELVETQLSEMKDQLVKQTRLAAIGQVAASIAHELRNPLGAVRNAAWFLKRRNKGKIDEKWVDYLNIIDQEVVVADRIIANLLEMSRAKEPHQKQFDLHHLLKQSFDRIVGENEVELEYHSEPSPFLLCADPDQLTQVFSNLMLNAIQAMDHSGIIRVEAEESDGQVTIMISDTGLGIALDAASHIFEPLFTTKAKGTGLGLAICRQIIERHGGSIELYHHHKGSGACFLITLPNESAV